MFVCLIVGYPNVCGIFLWNKILVIKYIKIRAIKWQDPVWEVGCKGKLRRFRGLLGFRAHQSVSIHSKLKLNDFVVTLKYNLRK